MPNVIELAKTYVPLLDKKYVQESKSAILDGNEFIVKLAENGKEFLLPKIDMDGLADHSRGGNYVDGDVTLEYETHQPDYDRSRMFSVDAMDNLETAGEAFGELAGEFIRTKTVPEIDAVRFSKYATKAIGAGHTAELELNDGKKFLDALEKATISMDEAEVPAEGRILFVTSSVYTPVLNLDTYRSREILGKFEKIVTVPQGRFYSAIKLNDGKTGGQEKGGFEKDAGAKDLNFLIVARGSVVQTLKHKAPKIVTPEQNQTGDNWKYGYRVYGIAEPLENKIAGLYAHTKPIA